MFVPTDAVGADVLARVLDRFPRRAHRRAGGGLMDRLDASELAQRLADNAEAVCRHYLSAGRRQGALLACRRCPQHAGPVHVRAAQGDREGPGRQMDRRRHRRARRSARRHPRKPRPCRLQGRRRRSAFVPQPAATGAGDAAHASRIAGSLPDGLIRRGATPLRHVASDRADSRGGVSPPTRHYGFARNRKPALPPALLLPARRA